MPWRQDKYADVAKRFKEWLRTDNEGDFVTDLSLDYLNRARRKLNVYRPWKLLFTIRHELTLTDRAVAVPDSARIWAVYEDQDGDGLPDFWYFENTTRTDDGYYITETYTKAAGWSRTITFYVAPASTPYMDYIKLLDDFTTNDTGYCFFPGELLLATAKMLQLEDDGRIGTDEYKLIYNRFQEEERDFTQAQVENYDMRMEVKDDRGRRVAVESYSLSDGTDERGRSRYDNDVDLRS